MITCTFEDKGEAHLRHVTVNAIVVKDGKILLGRRGTYKGKPLLEAGKYALLGGFFDRNEYLEQAIQREIYEESGWEIADITLFRINDNPLRPAEDRQNVDIIFIVRAVKQTGRSDEEVSNLVWFDLSNLPKKEEVAFDHFDSLVLYKKYLEGQVKIPILGPIII